jgi:TRAP-type C4-dicarboxylate transport system substrate-binding protein
MTLILKRTGHTSFSSSKKYLAGLAMVLGSSLVDAATLKIATVSPDGSGWVKSMRAAGDRIAKATDKRVKLKLYPGGVMGGNDAVMRKIKIGQLHGAALPGGAFMQFNPDSQVYNLPFTYRSQSEIDYVREHLDETIKQGFEQGGMVTFGMAGGGFAYIMSKSDPVSSVADLKQQKVWIPNDDPGATKALGDYGVSPIPLSLSDVLPSLQTGLINTVATSPLGAIALQWHTQIKHMTDLPVLYLYATMGVSKKAFNKLSANDQAVFRREMSQAFEEIENANLKDNQSAFDALVAQGVNTVQPSPEELLEWRRIAVQARASYIKVGNISPEIVTKVDALLKTYRNQASTSNAH